MNSFPVPQMAEMDDDPIVTIPPVIVSPLSFTALDADPEQITLRDLKNVWQISGAGSGVKVGIIDTGVDDNHSEVRDRVKKTYDATGSSRGAYDVQGHGSHVASLVAGTRCGSAPKADLYCYKGLGDQGWGRSSWIAKCVYEAISDGVDVINMSLGSSQASGEIYNALKEAFKAGILVCAATGNDGRSRNSYPADFNDVCIGIAAVDFDGNRARFSNAGSGTDACDYGVNVFGAQAGGGFVRFSGTSMATPVATAMVANRLSYEKRFSLPRPANLLERYRQLQQFCDDLSRNGRDPETGWGQINAKRAFGTAPTETGPGTQEPEQPQPDTPVSEEVLGRIVRTPSGEVFVRNRKDTVLVL